MSADDSAANPMAEEAEAVLLHLVTRVPLLRGKILTIDLVLYELNKASDRLGEAWLEPVSVAEDVQEFLAKAARLLARVDDDLVVQLLAGDMPFEVVRTTAKAINQ